MDGASMIPIIGKKCCMLSGPPFTTLDPGRVELTACWQAVMMVLYQYGSCSSSDTHRLALLRPEGLRICKQMQPSTQQCTLLREGCCTTHSQAGSSSHSAVVMLKF